jgi:hypothetical protein
VRHSRDYADRYSLYRVHSLESGPRLFILEGEVTRHLHLIPTQYRARIIPAG